MIWSVVMDKNQPVDMQALMAASQEATKREQKAAWNKSLSEADAIVKLGKAAGKIKLSTLLSLHETAWDMAGETELRYPKWQFDPLVLPHMSEIIEILKACGYSSWRIHDFMVRDNELLGEVPLQVLREGGHDAVFEAARVDHESY
jgi:hypothetical protein